MPVQFPSPKLQAGKIKKFPFRASATMRDREGHKIEAKVQRYPGNACKPEQRGGSGEDEQSEPKLRPAKRQDTNWEKN